MRFAAALASLIAALVASFAAAAQGRVTVFEPNRGLPDYVSHSPFHAASGTGLREEIAAAQAAKQSCTVGAVPVPGMASVPLSSNICDQGRFERMRALVAAMAPALRKDQMTLSKLTLATGREGLLVSQIDISNDPPFRYPYLSVWFVGGGETLSAVYGGTYLAGEVHALGPFGGEAGRTMVFVKHQSCIECEPWIYLSVIDFMRPRGRNVFRFTYADDHRSFGDSIEYELPGMGHSVDARVQSRVPMTHQADGPHLLQYYQFEDRSKDEWWVFTCRELTCDYQMHQPDLPQKYRDAWLAARKL